MDTTQNKPDDGRRSFLRQCTGALAGITIVGTLAPLVQGCVIASSPPEGANTTKGITVDVSSLKNDNWGLITSDKGPDGQQMLVIRKSATTYTALSTLCTHKACNVDPPEADFRFHARPDATTDLMDTIWCICHDSRYDLSGMVLKKGGDPPLAFQAPLTKYTTTYDAARNTVTITF